MTVEQIIGPAKREELRKHLKSCFPHYTSKITDEVVDSFVVACWDSGDQQACKQHFGAEAPDQNQVKALKASLFPSLSPDGGTYAYYTAEATHERMDHPRSKFTAKLPLVRVQLAQTQAEQATFDTEIGTVERSDHTAYSVDEVYFQYAGDIPRPERVDLITPARLGGLRFGAIAVFLGYEKKNDPEPTFYVLEAGTATGEAVVPFLGRKVNEWTGLRRAFYAPTPFAFESDFYDGRLTVQGENPTKLHVKALHRSTGQPYVEVTVDYVPGPPTPRWPGFLIAEAAARVGAIAFAKGQATLEMLFAPAAPLLEWENFG